jgi:tetratricopeptide (TPR) repeat protein
MIGQAVSHYRVVSRLGSGGMGVVYEAEDTTLGRRVALKFLPPDLASDAMALERFQREARAASKLNHPGICTVYAIQEHAGAHFIAMELLEGETLAERIRRGPLALGELLELGVQIADERKRDTEGAYYLMLRALFAAGRYHDVAAVAEAALEASGTDYNVFVPICNALGALGKKDALEQMRQREVLALENHLKTVPEDARARGILAGDYAALGRVEDAVREANLSITLRPNEATVLYNAACVFCQIERKDEALSALRKAWEAGFIDADWVRRDPDLALLHGDPEFERLYPVEAMEGGAGGRR